MGTWGPKLYQDDLALDVKECYCDKLREGATNQEAFDVMLDMLAELHDDPDETPVFWFALADTMWHCGRLTEYVLQKALEEMDTGNHLARWQEQGVKYAKERECVLRELRAQWLSPQPPERKYRKTTLYTCPWTIGDVYAYPLDSDIAVEKGFAGYSLLFHKVGTTTWYPGHVVPVVRVKIARSDTLPQNEEAFRKLHYLKVGRRGYYQLMLLNTSKRGTPKKLQYLGCDPEIPSIPGEWDAFDEGEQPCSIWKRFDGYILDKLIVHNGIECLLRE